MPRAVKKLCFCLICKVCDYCNIPIFAGLVYLDPKLVTSLLKNTSPGRTAQTILSLLASSNRDVRIGSYKRKGKKRRYRNILMPVCFMICLQ